MKFVALLGRRTGKMSFFKHYKEKQMRKQTFLERIINWFKGLFGRKKKIQENSDELNREMCRKAIQSGACPHTCEICAWNTTLI